MLNILYKEKCMSMEERTTWVQAIVTTGSYLAYLFVVLRRSTGASLVEVGYVRPMLVTIGLSVVAVIVGAIVTAIISAVVSHDYEQKSDERDRQINRHGEYVGFFVLSAAAVGAAALAMAEAPYFWIANAIFLGFVLSNLVSSVVKIVVYRRGF